MTNGGNMEIKVGDGRALSNTISLDGLMLMNRHGVQGGLLGLGYSF